MGLLVDGEWQDKWYDTDENGGKFERDEASFRNWITADGSAGPSGEAGFEAESGRYHMYVSLACPWAHRALVFRKLKELEAHIDVSVVHPHMMENGWELDDSWEGATGDTLFDAAYLREIYLKDTPDMTGRVTVPLLWDKKQGRIVSNESSEIIRMFNSAFDGITGNTDDYWPRDLRADIEPVNDRIYNTVNNGVYKAGFASSQEAYDEAVQPLFDSLDWIEDILSKNRYLMGDRITEADWRLWTTLMRFDNVYNTHFKCNRARIVDYPNLWGYTRELYQWQTPEGPVSDTVNMDHIVNHYYYSHDMINPNRTVPINPWPDFSQPHGRG
ncbi:glutathione S-transferase family protein [Salipiger sp. IMCC34102]|uniref:glutathione S-transferase family protein n=1 Tax=Salipiger sp. IMCC34102 TaxID=2510647 RepID=UPI00101CA174|nr:glutathione S-transferase family protein [Salipiger sp. IMCC34102]RYH01653.1 glutathione S-transferase family protein [Salipiger sp. IMCC34102]